MWPCCVVYLECLPQWCLGWHQMVSVAVVTCWKLKALTEVKLVNTNAKPSMSVVMQQRQQAFTSNSSCPVHVSLLAYLPNLVPCQWIWIRNHYSPVTFYSWLAIFLPCNKSSLCESTSIYRWFCKQRPSVARKTFNLLVWLGVKQVVTSRSILDWLARHLHREPRLIVLLQILFPSF